MKHLGAMAFILFLSACAGEDSGTTIDRGGSGRPPGEKPKATLSKHVMLTLAGLSELHELLNLTLNNTANTSCTKRSDKTLEWNCSEDQTRPAGRRGIMDLETQTSRLKLSSAPLALQTWARMQSRLVRANQELSLEIVNSNISFSNSYIYQVAQGAGPVRYQLNWQITGKVSGSAPNFSLQDSMTLLTITRLSGGRGKETHTQFQIKAEETLALSGCGTVTGNFTFSGFEQEELPVVADSKSVRSTKVANKHLWPACSSHLYGIKMAAPFWAQPNP